MADFVAQAVRASCADGEQTMPVRACAGASAAGLDAEQVVEHRDHEVMVQEIGAVPDPERDDGQPGRLAAAEDLDSRTVGPTAQHMAPQPLLAGGDTLHGFKVAIGGDGESSFDHVDAEAVE